jgi:hypothetical protein
MAAPAGREVGVAAEALALMLAMSEPTVLQTMPLGYRPLALTCIDRAWSRSIPTCHLTPIPGSDRSTRGPEGASYLANLSDPSLVRYARTVGDSRSPGAASRSASVGIGPSRVPLWSALVVHCSLRPGGDLLIRRDLHDHVTSDQTASAWPDAARWCRKWLAALRAAVRPN